VSTKPGQLQTPLSIAGDAPCFAVSFAIASLTAAGDTGASVSLFATGTSIGGGFVVWVGPPRPGHAEESTAAATRTEDRRLAVRDMARHSLRRGIRVMGPRPTNLT